MKRQSHFYRFTKDQRGNVAITFALCLIPIVSFMGTAIDYGRVSRARQAMQHTLDSTALMLSRDVKQGTITDTSAANITTKAQAYFKALYTNTEAQGVTISATYTPAAGLTQATVSLKSSGYVKSDFMQLAGFPTLGFGASSTTGWLDARLRVALVLDNTGSMADNGKMVALKAASKALVDQLTKEVPADSDQVLISLVPFNQAVNVGSQNYDANWLGAWTQPRDGAYQKDAGSPRTLTATGFPAWEAEPLKLQSQKPMVSGQSALTWSTVPWNLGTTPNCPFGYYGNNVGTMADSQWIDPNTTYSYYTLNGAPLYSFACQMGRAASPPTNPPTDINLRISKNVPSSGLICPSVDLWNHIYYNGCYDIKNGRIWTPNSHSTWNGCVSNRDKPYDTQNDPPTSSATNFPVYQAYECPVSLRPLSNNFVGMKTQIDAMLPFGATNQVVGLAWGWMLLTPNNPFGPGSSLNAPADTDTTVTYNRAVILLSDGLNTQNRWSTGNGQDPAPDVDARQQLLCTNMKNAGITIYTIQVNTGADPRSDALAKCASSSNDFFYLTSADQILETFNNIGAQLNKLRITQ